MMSGDEITSDGVVDFRAAADFRLAELRHTSSCPACGSREPVRLGRDMDGIYGCSDCRVYERDETGAWTLAEEK